MSVKWLEGGSMDSIPKQKLLARYVHNDNKVITPISLDKTTGIWTAQPTGLATGIYQNIIGVPLTYNNGVIPREITNGTNLSLEIIDDTHFYLLNGSTTANRITSYPNVNNTSVDPTQYRFEFNPSIKQLLIDISAYDLQKIKVITQIHAKNQADWNYVNLVNSTNGNNTIYTGFGGVSAGLFCTFWVEYVWKYSKESGILHGQIEKMIYKYWNASSGVWTITQNNGYSANDNYISINRPQNFKFVAVRVDFIMSNGSIVEVYDIGGE